MTRASCNSWRAELGARVLGEVLRTRLNLREDHLCPVGRKKASELLKEARERAVNLAQNPARSHTCYPSDFEEMLNGGPWIFQEVVLVYRHRGLKGFFAGCTCRAAWMGLGGFIFLGSFELAKPLGAASFTSSDG